MGWETVEPANWDSVTARFAKLLSTQLALALLSVILGLALAFGAAVGSDLTAPLLVAFVVLLAYSGLRWRCPACGGWLGRTIFPTYCPRCGVALRESSGD